MWITSDDPNDYVHPEGAAIGCIGVVMVTDDPGVHVPPTAITLWPAPVVTSTLNGVLVTRRNTVLGSIIPTPAGRRGTPHMHGAREPCASSLSASK